MGSKKRKPKGIYLEYDLLQSKAWLHLTTKGAAQALTFFYLRRNMQRSGTKGDRKYIVVNQGKIEFTYSEAARRFGWSMQRFSSILRALYVHGFIDVVELGGAFQGVKTKYAISDRWKPFGTPEFKDMPWPEDRVQRGWRKGKRKERAAT